MATITLTIPDDKLIIALDACANQTGWDPAGSTTKGQHAKQQLWKQVKEWVRDDLLNQAHDTGVASVEAEMATWP